MECKNCHTQLSDSSGYCYRCGGKVIRNRLTLRNLFEHFSETFFNYDNKFLQTFIALFRQPEEVIGSYINGTRKKYVDVISYFAISLTISGLQIFIINKFFPELMNMDMLGQKGAEEFNKKNLSFTQEYHSLLYMLGVPIYALISRVVFWGQKTFNYTEHLVINMYLSAHFAIVSAILVILTSAFGLNFVLSAFMVLSLQIVYSAYCFKRILNMEIGTLIFKTILFLFVLFFTMLLLIIVTTSIMYLTGDLQQIIEAQKTAKGI